MSMERTAQIVIKELASRVHLEVLKAKGFKKTANTWIRKDEWPKLINLQLSQWNSAREANFTINLGVFIPELHTVSESYPVKGNLKELDCGIRSRIGTLLPLRKDKWWTVGMEDDSNRLFDEVCADLVSVGLPWLENLKDFLVVAEELKSQKQWFMAGLAYKLAGDDCLATELMTKAHAKANKFALPKLKRVAAKQGIPIVIE